ncbi:MAG: hypothetical protein QNJ12_04320 [Ilumatobacter sp.]|uniref:hypothetical protein n=1 Tax=Ilumatobacter sp. TaxID=1967498 RepID=UPI00260F578E|nr:hypothetical protein [Ilumatobacter sp.]MDJ0767990.1 hypothetical protein [Ilumatobacter sp.]
METTPHSQDRRSLGGVILASAIVSALLVGVLAYSATNAAFTGVTGNTGNTFEAATVSLTDDDFGGTNFQVTDMIPGDTVTDCIEVEYTGSTTDLAGLRLYGASSGDLADDLDLNVRHGAAGSSCAAPGALTGVYSGDLDALGTDWATGSAGFTPTATNETVAYVFDVTLKATTTDAAQGDTASADFTWEVRSN